MTLKKLESKLWKIADSLRGSLNASQYKDLLLPLIFLKSFSFLGKKLHNHKIKINDVAKWKNIIKTKDCSKIKIILDNAFAQIVKDNNKYLANCFPPNFFANQNYPCTNLLKLINDIESFFTNAISNFDGDLVGKIYEYFLKQFALASGRKNGEFYTPSSVIDLLVSLVNIEKGSLYDPCFGTGGIFIQVFKYLRAKTKKEPQIEIFGQEKNFDSWSIGKQNLLLHQIFSQNFADTFGCTFLQDQYKKKTFDFILTNPPFNLKEYWNDFLQKDKRWTFGIPPKRNANYAWIQHIISKLNQNGIAAFVMSNGSLTENATKKIRQNLIKDNLIDAIIALPPNLFYSTQISSCIWIIRKNKKTKNVLFINGDHRNFLQEEQKTIFNISKKGIDTISSCYQKFCQKKIKSQPNFCTFVAPSLICENHYSFLPNQYIEFIDQEFQDIDLDQEIAKTKKEIIKLRQESKKNDAKINFNLRNFKK